MKRITPVLLLLFLLINASYAQDQVRDVFPNASISVIDYQSGQQVPVRTDDAILFKDAFINLVINTQTARMHNTRMIPGRKTVRVTQADPQANGNAFQLDLETTSFGRTQIVYSFLYNVDQNTLYYYSPQTRNWVPEVVQGNNVINMNNCLAYGKFNQANGQPDQNVQGGNQGDDGSEYDGPVDTDVQAETAPPPLPEYEQPECPTDGYLWQPGYWAFSPVRGGYYWVPGVWVAPPTVGYLWTPPYWGFVGGRYVFHIGYWGPHIGFYGGINYGFGYIGVGFVGGEWHEGHFRYNTAVVRVNTVVVHNTYVNRTVINNTTVVNNRVSFNGGQGGVTARPSQAELSANNDHHVMATAEQNRNQQLARSNNAQFASNNHGGAPSNLAAQRPPDRSAFTNMPRNSGQRNNMNNNQGGNAAQRPNNNPNQRNGGFGNQGQRPNGQTPANGNNPGTQGNQGQRPNGNATPGNNPNVQGGQRPNRQTPANGNNPNTQQGNHNQRQNNNGRQQRGQRNNNNRQPKQQHEDKEKKN